jgi:hypothetical protein
MKGTKKYRWQWLIAASSLVMASQSALAAEDGWRFGLGSGFTSFSLDGDIGFPTTGGGVIESIDVSNSDTSDMLQSAFGVNGFAARDEWTIVFAFGRVSLKDKDAGLSAKWDKTQAEVSAVYQFASFGNNRFGAQLGVRYTKHDWDLNGGALTGIESPNEDWTDAIIGLTHALPLSDAWTWRSAANYGFGGSDGTTFVQTGLLWQPHEHWRFNVDARYLDTKYGDKSDINKSDFYYYDVKEPAFGIGFMYVW